MSAVQGPIPCTAVSAACASSAEHLSSAARSRRPVSIADGDRLQRPYLRRRQAQPRQALARARRICPGSNGIVGCAQPGPDRLGAGGRHLLRDNDRGEPGKAGGTAPRRWGAGDGEHLRKRGSAISKAMIASPRSASLWISGTIGIARIRRDDDNKIARCQMSISVSFRAQPERLSAPRPCLLGAGQFRAGARGRRPLPAAHRGHRPHPLPPAFRGGDL